MPSPAPPDQPVYYELRPGAVSCPRSREPERPVLVARKHGDLSNHGGDPTGIDIIYVKIFGKKIQ